MSRRATLLPVSLPPLGICREEAAAFIGVGVTLFDKLVDAGRMPQPRMPSDGRLVWDVEELATAFRRLPHRSDPELDLPEKADNPWD